MYIISIWINDHAIASMLKTYVFQCINREWALWRNSLCHSFWNRNKTKLQIIDFCVCAIIEMKMKWNEICIFPHEILMKRWHFSIRVTLLKPLFQRITFTFGNNKVNEFKHTYLHSPINLFRTFHKQMFPNFDKN